MGRFALPVRDGQGGLRLTPGLDPEEWARGKVERQDVWAVVLVRGNATVVALQALQGGGGGEYDRECFLHLRRGVVAKRIGLMRWD